MPVNINYALRETPDGWKIYDVRIDGVSYIQNYRSQFDAEISDRGIDAVIQASCRLAQSGGANDLGPGRGLVQKSSSVVENHSVFGRDLAAQECAVLQIGIANEQVRVVGFLRHFVRPDQRGAGLHVPKYQELVAHT